GRERAGRGVDRAVALRRPAAGRPGLSLVPRGGGRFRTGAGTGRRAPGLRRPARVRERLRPLRRRRRHARRLPGAAGGHAALLRHRRRGGGAPLPRLRVPGAGGRDRDLAGHPDLLGALLVDARAEPEHPRPRVRQHLSRRRAPGAGVPADPLPLVRHGGAPGVELGHGQPARLSGQWPGLRHAPVRRGGGGGGLVDGRIVRPGGGGGGDHRPPGGDRLAPADAAPARVAGDACSPPPGRRAARARGAVSRAGRFWGWAVGVAIGFALAAALLMPYEALGLATEAERWRAWLLTLWTGGVLCILFGISGLLGVVVPVG